MASENSNPERDLDPADRLEQITQEIFQRHGIHIDPDDPVIQILYLILHEIAPSQLKHGDDATEQDEDEEQLAELRNAISKDTEEILAMKTGEVKQGIAQIDTFLTQLAKDIKITQDQSVTKPAAGTPPLPRRLVLILSILAVSTALVMVLQLVLLFTIPLP